MQYTLAFFVGVALLAGSALAAARIRTVDEQWEKGLNYMARKFDLDDYTSFRAGKMDRDELAVHVAKAFNAAAYRDMAACTFKESEIADVLNCGLTIPGIDLEVAAIELWVNSSDIQLAIIIAGQRIVIEEKSVPVLFTTGIDIPIAKYITQFGPPGVNIVASMLVADIVVKAQADPDNSTHSQFCLDFRVGMQGPFGYSVPGFPAPALLKLICQSVDLLPPGAATTPAPTTAVHTTCAPAVPPTSANFNLPGGVQLTCQSVGPFPTAAAPAALQFTCQASGLTLPASPTPPTPPPPPPAPTGFGGKASAVAKGALNLLSFGYFFA